VFCLISFRSVSFRFLVYRYPENVLVVLQLFPYFLTQSAQKNGMKIL
jgi:hypothetical protein